MPLLCNLCNTNFNDSNYMLKCKSHIAYCYSCIRKSYQRDRGGNTIRLACGHGITAEELIQFLRKTCPLCQKAVGKLYYQLEDGTRIDAPCFQFAKNKSEIKVSKCRQCAIDIGITWMKEAVAPASGYSYKQPLCASCKKKREGVARHQSKQVQKTKAGICRSCQRNRSFCQQVLEGVLLCTTCKINQQVFYSKKDNDPNFSPELYGKTLSNCYICDEKFFPSELKKNYQTKKMCCSGCDYQIRADEKKILEKQRINDSYLDNQYMPQIKSQHLDENNSVAKQRNTNGSKATHRIFKPKKPQEPEPALPLPPKITLSQPVSKYKFSQINLQPIKQCQHCFTSFPSDTDVSLESVPFSSFTARNNRFKPAPIMLCLECSIVQVNRKKKEKKQMKRSQTQNALRGCLGKKVDEVALLPKKLLTESSEGEKKSDRKETAGLYYATGKDGEQASNDIKDSLLYSKSLHKCHLSKRSQREDQIDNLQGLNVIEVRFSKDNSKRQGLTKVSLNQRLNQIKYKKSSEMLEDLQSYNKTPLNHKSEHPQASRNAMSELSQSCDFVK